MSDAQKSEIKDANYKEIIEWLEKFFNKKTTVKHYRGCEYSKEFIKDIESAKKEGKWFSIDPMLPIDFLTVVTKDETDDASQKLIPVSYYTLFWILFEDDDKIERMCQFYRFYLSRISKLKGVKIILVISDKASETLEKSLLKKSNDNGFGLWKIALANKVPIKLAQAKDYREHIKFLLRNPTDEKATKFSKTIKKQAHDITLFYDQFIREAVESMVGITPNNVGKRYIERKILDLVFELDSVSYANSLKKAVTNHLIKKGNDYDFVSKTFSELWKECNFTIEYSDFLKNWEPPLHFISYDKGYAYRDHYLHQFQVFLTGLYIIDKLGINDNNLDKKWLITSSLHDVGYPIQLYDKWAKDFFNDAFKVPDMGVTDMKSHYVDGSFLTCTGDLINSLCNTYEEEPLSGNWLRDKKDLVDFFHEKITKDKHHCVISSIFLMKKGEDIKDPDILKNYFLPSAFAISIHHPVVWKKLCEKKCISNLQFEKEKLAFLLLFCDAAQEWGRPKDEEFIKGKILDEQSFFLENFEVSPNNCAITIKSPYIGSNHKIFKDKISELQLLQRFLKPPSTISFKITLIDSIGKHPFEFPMHGD